MTPDPWTPTSSPAAAWAPFAALALALALSGCIADTSADAADPPPEGVFPVGDGGLDGRSPSRDGGPRDSGGPRPDDGVLDPIDRGRPGPPDAGDPGCRSVGPALDRTVDLPLGETLFFEGDDYLHFWGTEHPCAPILFTRPPGAAAVIADGRLTPDRVGDWILRRGDDRVTVQVRDDLLDEDTFLNYNYSPTHPLAVGDPDRLWVASPTSSAVQEVVLDADGRPERGALVPVGGWPTALVWWPGARTLLVAQTARDSLGLLDVDGGRLVDAIRVGDEPAAIVIDETSPREPVAWVALSGEDAVARVDLNSRRVTDRIPTGRDPRALALDAARGRLYVASHLSSNAHPRGRAGDGEPPESQRQDVTVIDTRSRDRVGAVPHAGTILRGLWLDPEDAGRLLVAMTDADNDTSTVMATSRALRHGLSEIRLDADPAGSGVRAVPLDGRSPAASPFSLAATPDGRWLLVTLSAGSAVMVLDRQSLTEQARLPAGATPRGLAFAGGRVWTYAWLDEALIGWPLDRLDRGPAPVMLEVGADPTPARVRAGQRIFNDARFSALGDVACNSCHPDGLVDGLVWNLLLDGDVNTLPFRNVGGTDPFLWGGQLPTLFDFSREVLRLVGASATGEQMELLTEYVQSVTAPPNPYTLPGGRPTPAAERGRAVFQSAGCVACHSGPLLTNRQRVAGKTPGPRTDVPSLIGVYDTGPWGREGQWDTLDGMIDFALDFTGADVDPGQRDDLLAYVRELPGDLLYMTAARPLSGSRSVYHLVPIELAFSSTLAGGQADLFTLEVQQGDGWRALPGGWQISGRYARYRGDPLPFESRFRIRVDAGLTGTLGFRLGGPVEVTFETGRLPDMDSTGRWQWDIRGAVGGTIIIALLQATGGHVSGALIDGDGLIDLDHLEGFVSGSTLFIDPFPVLSPFGEVIVESAEIDLVDTDGDDVADQGAGTIVTPFVDLQVTARRTGP